MLESSAGVSPNNMSAAVANLLFIPSFNPEIKLKISSKNDLTPASCGAFPKESIMYQPASQQASPL